MNLKLQCVALYTLTRRELVRMFRIPSQVFLPSIMTSVLYFLIFGDVIGHRVGLIAGHNFNSFIAPGLIMMAVINNAYSNVSSSLFSVRFQKSIEEMLVSPMHWSVLILGYTLGGMFRGSIIGVMLLLVAYFFAPIDTANIPLIFLVIVLVSALFSLAGFINGMFAKTFDGIAFVPTFILTPLTYLGGVFYTSTMLPAFWQHLTTFNPIFYMVNALRYAMIGEGANNMHFAMAIIIGSVIVLTLITCVLVKKNIGLRD